MEGTFEEAEVWGVFANTDMTEGRGQPVSLLFTRDEWYARDYAKGRGPSGGSACVRKMSALVQTLPSGDLRFYRHVVVQKPSLFAQREYEANRKIHEARDSVVQHLKSDLGLSPEDIRKVLEELPR